jgi:hypothetical protein
MTQLIDPDPRTKKVTEPSSRKTRLKGTVQRAYFCGQEKEDC